MKPVEDHLGIHQERPLQNVEFVVMCSLKQAGSNAVILRKIL